MSQSTKQFTVATLLSVRSGGGDRIRLATLVKAAGCIQLLVESRRSGALICGLRLAATLVVAPPAAARRRRRRLLRLRRQSRCSSSICCHKRRRRVLPRRRVSSGGRAGRRRRRRRRISRESRDFHGGHAVAKFHKMDFLSSTACRRRRRGSRCRGRRQASRLHHLEHNSFPELGRLGRVTHRGRVKKAKRSALLLRNGQLVHRRRARLDLLLHSGVLQQHQLGGLDAARAALIPRVARARAARAPALAVLV